MRLLVILSKVGITIGLVAITVLSQAAIDKGNTCMQLMYDHGLATSAQLNCGFEYYNQNVINEASMCMKKAKDFGASAAMEDALRNGLSDFQYQFNEMKDKRAICTAFLNEFSDFVSN